MTGTSESTRSLSVCLIHGLWMNGREMILLGKRLEAMGFNVVRFSYPSRSATILENAHRLAEFLETSHLQGCSFVCHSYGGLVLCRYLQESGKDWPARVVFLGSPVCGSSLAKRLGGLRLVQILAGRSLPALRKGCGRGLYGHHCSMIAGSLNLGMGMFFLRGPADGMVAVSDTAAPWLEEHTVIRCSHLALLFSRRAALACARFLLQA